MARELDARARCQVLAVTRDFLFSQIFPLPVAVPAKIALLVLTAALVRCIHSKYLGYYCQVLANDWIIPRKQCIAGLTSDAENKTRPQRL
ncbi:uncharacterized protein RCO7_15055 [Rhynchosporium graminicola]|uniref:Uncharacterized protein n=1 Tax=Rhynchosporium graminicola TaxID=2792576 RepID=A0A1E1LIF9_9HELO|nr:uncharacterized protein RCO7_15055 [Rhynchosporium commune]